MKREAIASLALAVVGAVLFTALLVTVWIGEWAYLALMVGLAVACLALYGFRRLKVLDLKEGRLVLEQVERAKKEVFARAEDLKAITYDLAVVLALNNSLIGRMSSEERGYQMLQWNRHRLGMLLERLRVSPQEQIDALRTIDRLIEFDETKDKEERRRLSRQLDEWLIADLKRFGRPTSPSRK